MSLMEKDWQCGKSGNVIRVCLRVLAGRAFIFYNRIRSGHNLITVEPPEPDTTGTRRTQEDECLPPQRRRELDYDQFKASSSWLEW